MDDPESRPLSSLLRAPGETPDGLQTDQLRAATRSALFGEGDDDVRMGRFIVGACIGQGAMAAARALLTEFDVVADGSKEMPTEVHETIARARAAVKSSLEHDR